MACFGLILFMWCNPPAAPVPSGATFCQIYKPVRWSRSDTRRTKEETDLNNRKLVRLCRKGK